MAVGWIGLAQALGINDDDDDDDDALHFHD